MADEGIAASLRERDSAAGNPGSGEKDSPAGFTNESSCGSDEPGIYGRPASFWDTVQRDYADRAQTVRSIEEKHGLTKWQLQQAVTIHHWTPRTTKRTKPRPLVKRLLGLLDGQVERLEKNAAEAGNADAELLTKLVGTLGKLKAMEKADKAAPAEPRTTVEMLDIRNKLVERIEALKRR